VTHRPAAGADNIVGHILLVLTLPGLVVSCSTVCASHCSILSQSSVQQRQLSQLHLPQLIGSLGHLHSLLDNFLDLVDSFLDTLGIRGSNVGMERLVLTRQGLTIFPPDLALLDTALATNNDLSSGLFLHVLQSVSSGSNQQSHEVNVRVIVLRNHHLVAHFNHWRLVIWWRFVLRVHEHHLLDAVVSHLLQLFPLPVFPGVQPLAIRGVDWLR